MPQLILDKEGNYNPQELNKVLRYLGEAVNSLAGRTGGVEIHDDVLIDGALEVTEGITGQLLSNQELEDTDPAIILQRELDNEEAVNVEGPSISFESSLGVVENFQQDAVLLTKRNVQLDSGAVIAPSLFQITMPDTADATSTTAQKEMFAVRLGNGTDKDDTTFVDGTSPSLGAHLQLRKLNPSLAELTDVPFTMGTVEFAVDTEAMIGGDPEALGATIKGVVQGVFGGVVTAGDLEFATSNSGLTTRAILKSSGALQGSITDNGAYWEKGSNSELLTLTAANTDTVGNLLPANSVIDAVVAFVTETATQNLVNPTAFRLGDPTTATRFGGGFTPTQGSTAVGIAQWGGAVTTDAAGPTQLTAAKVRVGLVGGSGGVLTGKVRVTVFYTTFFPPTS